MLYRTEIDGLRAVSVLAVIFFHAEFHWIAGGFVGVDVFFVISGFLITNILQREFAEDRFSLIRFYERRARRILPALVAMCAVCLVYVSVFFSAAEQADFGRSLIALALFASNIFFFTEVESFTLPLEQNPLVHSWSLSVEEQFYIFFPLLLMLLHRQRMSLRWAVLLLIFAVSLGAAEWGATHLPHGSFFLLPMRAWELVAGALCAVYLADRGALTPWYGGGVALIGLGMIFGAIFTYGVGTPAPSLYTCVPVGGAVLVILFAAPGTLAHRLLSLPICVGIGLISYSAYLWHHALFAFGRHYLAGEVDEVTFLGLIALSLGMAILSWRYVETPYRTWQAPYQRVFKHAAIALAGFISVGTVSGFALM